MDNWIKAPGLICLSGMEIALMPDKLAAKLESAAIPNPDFDRLSLAEIRAWLQSYLEEGTAPIASGQSISLESEADVDALFDTIRVEAHEKAGLNR